MQKVLSPPSSKQEVLASAHLCWNLCQSAHGVVLYLSACFLMMAKAILQDCPPRNSLPSTCSQIFFKSFHWMYQKANGRPAIHADEVFTALNAMSPRYFSRNDFIKKEEDVAVPLDKLLPLSVTIYSSVIWVWSLPLDCLTRSHEDQMRQSIVFVNQKSTGQIFILKSQKWKSA